MEEFIGIIKIFGGNFAPSGWALCQGQLLPISQNTALFSILGTTYGGDGQTTFALPNLCGRVPVGMGTGAGLTITEGQIGGESTVTLLATQIPSHTHSLMVNSGEATTNVPTSAMTIAAPGAPSGRSSTPTYGFISSAANTALAPSSIGPNSGGQPHDNMPPYLGVNYIICLQGVFPSRG